jgi:hypothetical protein
MFERVLKIIPTEQGYVASRSSKRSVAVLRKLVPRNRVSGL